MAQRVFPYNFESFKGLDYRRTPLQGDILSADILDNFQFGESFSIRGRPGVQLIAAPGGFVGLTTFSYNNLATNTPTQELIAINDNLWKLNVYTQEIVRGSSATWGVRTYVDGGNTIRLEITESGTPVSFSGNDFYALGHGQEDAPVTVLDAFQAIDALANYTVTIGFEYARVNGAQAGVNTITVDSGHTYATNDEIEFFDFTSLKLVSRLVTGTAATTITVDGPTVTVKDNQVLGAVALTPAAAMPIAEARERTGTSRFLIFHYWTKVRETVSDSIALGKSYAPFQNFFSQRLHTDFRNPCFLSSDTDLYALTEVPGSTIYEWEQRPFKYDGQVVFRAGLHRPYYADAAVGSAGALTGVYKWKLQYEQRDAQGYIHLSQPSQEFPGEEITLASEMAVLTIYPVQTDYGTERFADTDKIGTATVVAAVNGTQAGVTTIVTLAQNSFKINDTIYFLDRITSTYTMRRVTAATQLSITIDGAAVNVDDTDPLYHGYAGYNIKYAQVNGNQNNVSTVTVDSGHGFKAGDAIFIRGNDGSGAIKYHDIVLSSVTGTTLVWDATKYGTVYVRDNEIISCGLKIHIYRTKAGGSIYYEVDILANAPTGPVMAYTDNTADTALGAELIEPEIGKEWNPPPRAGIATFHQGVMTYGRIRDDLNSVAFSDSVGGLEAVPLASNYFSVPGKFDNGVTALASDDADSLFVFKERAIHRADGILESNAFSLLTLKSEDYGIAAHSSIAKINGMIVGLGSLGFVAIRNGQMLMNDEGGSWFGFNINPAILRNSNLKLSQAIGYNEYLSRHYHCFIPDVDGNSSGSLNQYSIFFVCDYEKNNTWFTNSFNTSFMPSGGFGIAALSPTNYDLWVYGIYPNYYIPHVYHLTRNYDSAGSGTQNQMPGCLFREFSNQLPELMQGSDHNQSYVCKWRTDFETLQDPLMEKEFSRVEIWSLPGSYESRPPFSLTVKTYRDFQTATVSSQSTLDFTNTSRVRDQAELALTKCSSMSFEFSKTIFTFDGVGVGLPFISGLAITASMPYRKEDIKK